MGFVDPSVGQYFAELGRLGYQRNASATVAGSVDPGEEGEVAALVQRNLRFVVKVAKQYRGMGLTFGDLIGEGNLGLITAARRYDPTRGVKFISYAVWWIRHSILKALEDNARAVRPPSTLARSLMRMEKTAARLEQELGRSPGNEELASAMHMVPREIEDLKQLQYGDASLSPESTTQDAERFPREWLADPDDRTGEHEVLTGELHREIHRAIRALPPVEMKVVCMYYGLDDLEPMTLEAIGTHFRRSRERIRQVKQRAINRLRTAALGRDLRSYLRAD